MLPGSVTAESKVYLLLRIIYFDLKDEAELRLSMALILAIFSWLKFCYNLISLVYSETNAQFQKAEQQIYGDTIGRERL